MTAIAIVFAAPGIVTGVAALAIVVLMVAMWAISVRVHDVSIVDPVWGPAFVVVAVAALVTAGDGDSARRWLLFILTAAWGLRLGGYLVARKLSDPGEDRRYGEMRERRGDAFVLWSLFGIFGLQGLLVLIVSLPIQVAAQRPAALTAAVIPGILLFAVGLFFEAVGDEQMRRFKVGDHQGKVMDRGLWRYTRHPNYFGDFCVWWGLWLIALPAGGTWWTFIGPVVMTILLVGVSGKALTERDIGKRRPEYAGYVKRTSGFFPLPPRG